MKSSSSKRPDNNTLVFCFQNLFQKSQQEKYYWSWKGNIWLYLAAASVLFFEINCKLSTEENSIYRKKCLLFLIFSEFFLFCFPIWVTVVAHWTFWGSQYRCVFIQVACLWFVHAVGADARKLFGFVLILDLSVMSLSFIKQSDNYSFYWLSFMPFVCTSLPFVYISKYWILH